MQYVLHPNMTPLLPTHYAMDSTGPPCTCFFELLRPRRHPNDGVAVEAISDIPPSYPHQGPYEPEAEAQEYHQVLDP